MAWAIKRFNASKIFFGFDELHGINRDSRSHRAGRSNADALVFAMNSLQARAVPFVLKALPGF